MEPYQQLIAETLEREALVAKQQKNDKARELALIESAKGLPAGAENPYSFPHYKAQEAGDYLRLAELTDTSTPPKSIVSDVDAEVLPSNSIDPAKVAFLGVREYIVERRLRNVDEKIKQRTEDLRISRYVGTVILRNEFGESYWDKRENPELTPPKTKRQARTASKLHRLAEKRFKTVNKRVYAEKTTDTISRGEDYYDRRIQMNKEKHKKIVEKPKKKITKLVQKKQKLTDKKVSIEAAKSTI